MPSEINNSAKKNVGLGSNSRYAVTDLRACLEQAKKIYQKSGTNYLDFSSICTELELSDKSGYASRLFASLKYYKILEPHSQDKTFKLSDMVVDYAINGTITKDKLLESLLSVPIHKKLFNTYKIDNMPSDNVIKMFLIKNQGYQPKQAEEFLSVYKRNMNFYTSSFTEQLENTDISTPVENESQEIMRGHTTQKIQLPLTEGKYFTLTFPSNMTEEDKNKMISALDFITTNYIK